MLSLSRARCQIVSVRRSALRHFLLAGSRPLQHDPGHSPAGSPGSPLRLAGGAPGLIPDVLQAEHFRGLERSDDGAIDRPEAQHRGEMPPPAVDLRQNESRDDAERRQVDQKRLRLPLLLSQSGGFHQVARLRREGSAVVEVARNIDDAFDTPACQLFHSPDEIWGKWV